MRINEHVLTQQGKKVFESIGQVDTLKHFVLIGGTALALQIGHRNSLDLGFWLPGEKMNKALLQASLSILREQGLRVTLTTKPSQISQAKINGIDLLSYAQDYDIDGVKVTFFARYDPTYRYFSQLKRENLPQASFSIMSVDGLFHMKSAVIHERVKSRDLYDLYVLVRDHGYGVSDILSAGNAANISTSTEYAKEVLLGNVPLDKDDEGLDAVGLVEPIGQVYEFFSEQINQMEQSIAQNIKLNEASPDAPKKSPSIPKERW